MKIKLIKPLLLILGIAVLTNCSKNEDPVPNDDSLIIAEASTAKYVIVSPSTGGVRAQVEPNVNAITMLSLGYQSQKAIITSKEPSGTGLKAIYTCDRETGDNLFQVTSPSDWDVMFIDVAQTGPQIVFSAQNANLLSDDNIHKINEDGTGYARLSSPDEIVDCLGISCKLFSAYDPAWSPDGSQIAFDLHLREVVELHPHNSICIMDSNGNNKQVLYDTNVEEAHYQDICFTQDGEFLLFLLGAAGNEMKVIAIHISSKKVTDLTNHFIVNGLHPTNIWTSPNENQIVFNKYEPGGGDLYKINFTITGDQIAIEGTYSILSAYQDYNLHFGAPDWQLYNGN